MKERTTGIFFDGESAVPKEVELIFDIEKSVFVFETQNKQQHFWNFDEVSFQTKSKYLYLEYGDDPIQNIKIGDGDFVNSINDFRKKKGNQGWYHKLLDMGIKAHILFTIFIFAIIGLGYFYALPWVAEKAV